MNGESKKVANVDGKESNISMLVNQERVDYEFSTSDTRKERVEFERLQTKQSNLEKGIKNKVITIFAKIDDDYYKDFLLKDIENHIIDP